MPEVFKHLFFLKVIPLMEGQRQICRPKEKNFFCGAHSIETLTYTTL